MLKGSTVFTRSSNKWTCSKVRDSRQPISIVSNAPLLPAGTHLKSFQLPENTVVFTMHLKASSRTFPFVVFEEGSTIVRQILGKGDDT